MRKKLVAGNWKMNGRQQLVTDLCSELTADSSLTTRAEIIVFPPAIYIPLVSRLLGPKGIKFGAQNIYPKEGGAYTGEISVPMLLDYECRYVLVGHSERRHLFHEDENFVALKFHHVKEHGMIPILCVGETLEQRQNNRTKQVIADQLSAVINNDEKCFRNCVIAYEPVWAIGTGQTATPEQVQEVHQYIRTLVAEINEQDAAQLTVLYGGSVNEENAAKLFTMPDIDGGLVGGASLNAKQFLEIVKCIN